MRLFKIVEMLCSGMLWGGSWVGYNMRFRLITFISYKETFLLQYNKFVWKWGESPARTFDHRWTGVIISPGWSLTTCTQVRSRLSLKVWWKIFNPNLLKPVKWRFSAFWATTHPHLAFTACFSVENNDKKSQIMNLMFLERQIKAENQPGKSSFFLFHFCANMEQIVN